MVAILAAIFRYACIRAACPRFGARAIPYRSGGRVCRATPLCRVVTRRAKRGIAVVHPQKAAVDADMRVMASSALKLAGLIQSNLVCQDARIDQLSLLGSERGIVDERDRMII